ncbi:D-isomer specific 2-hydroxyacid dehydrogenase, NAD binding domain protein [Verrucomicrobiia bacterium DG1235]|nr:D-isomer specific 2-hydroxyacid dehydrogenase, NAD binding domain protein [Verrucomicrobiae bacterium DG1235]
MSLKIYVDFSLPSEALARLKEGASGHELVFPSKPAASVLAKTEPDPSFYQADIAFGQPDIDAIEKAASLKWIHINTSGITRYDTPEFRARMAERQIPVSNSASVYNSACADHALSFMMAQSRQLPQALGFRASNVSDDWFRLRRGSVSLKGQKALLIGYGAIGKRLAELLAPHHMQLSAYRRQARGDETIPVITEDELGASLATADHVINILPDSPSTRNFFDANRFAQCKTGSVYYNIGRGTTTDQDALHAALTSGQLKEAWLDVTEPEPLPDGHPLLSLPNCYITPHIAGGHFGEVMHCVENFLENLDRFTNGKSLVDHVI